MDRRRLHQALNFRVSHQLTLNLTSATVMAILP